MHTQSVASVMQNVSSKVAHTDLLQTAVTIMADDRYACVVVVDGDTPVGIITERDVVRWFANPRGNHGAAQVTRVMSSPPVKIMADVSLIEALLLLKARRVRHLLVMDAAGKLAGILTQTDLVEAYIGMLETCQQITPDVAKEASQLRRENRELLSLTMEDALTGIGNRRAMEVDLDHTRTSAERYGEAYQVALLDVDLFKDYNDRHGHPAGDECLRRIAHLLRDELRESDRLYRYGGEEFLVIMSKVSPEQAQHIAERLCEAAAAAAIPYENGIGGVVTLSAGVAPGSEKDWRTSVKNADAAMYRAKGEGRNRVELSSSR